MYSNLQNTTHTHAQNTIEYIRKNESRWFFFFFFELKEGDEEQNIFDDQMDKHTHTYKKEPGREKILSKDRTVFFFHSYCLPFRIRVIHRIGFHNAR